MKNAFLFGFLVFMLVGVSCGSEKKKTDGNNKINSYNNPLVLQRADPWVFKNDDGMYYFIATVPEYDRIEIRKANTINKLGDAEAVVVWKKHNKGVMGHHIWAPELHKIDGKWFIYFAAGEAEQIWNIRMWVLSNESADPTLGEWKEEGRILTQKESFSLDATTFEHKGTRYLIWAQNIWEAAHGTALKMSKMENPIKLTGPEIVITQPDLAWERIGFNVNEGPAVIKKNGKIFVTYSASATNHHYAEGLLWADENADLMDPASWNKSKEPVFFTNDSLKRFGPGHNSFTIAEDGTTDVMIYHARDYKEIQGDPLNDPNRNTRVRVINWNENGFPDFGQNNDD